VVLIMVVFANFLQLTDYFNKQIFYGIWAQTAFGAETAFKVFLGYLPDKYK